MGLGVYVFLNALDLDWQILIYNGNPKITN